MRPSFALISSYFQAGSVFPIFCDDLPDEKTWRTNNEKNSWRSAKEDKENLSNNEKNSWRTSKDENCAPNAASSRPLQRNKVIMMFNVKSCWF